MLETSVRLLRLLALLQARRDWSGAELAERLGVSTRTVRNDVERLRILGYRVSSTTGSAGGYRLAAGATLPPLVLEDDEAVAIALSLHAAAGGTVTGLEETALLALAKLQSLLPARLRARIDALRQATISLAGRGPSVDAGTLTAVATAIRAHETLRFDYRDHDGGESVRTAEPHRLVFTGHRWYLLAWDTQRRDWRTFRADRIRPRSPNGPRFTPREPPGGDAAAHVLRGTTSTAWAQPATVRLHVPVAVVERLLPPAAGLLRADGEDACVLETGADSVDYLVGFLTSLDLDFTVIDPPELQARLHALARRYLAA
jgi:predicted DNA-binding transcriptional regulator YafY